MSKKINRVLIYGLFLRSRVIEKYKFKIYSNIGIFKNIDTVSILKY